MNTAALLTPLLLFAACAAPAKPAAPLDKLGWYAELAGFCWKGEADRQCYQTQFDRYLRGTIAMAGGFEGDSVIGWSESKQAVVMYFWSNQSPGSEFRLSYDDDQLAFEEPAGAKSRTVWTRLGADEVSVETQSLVNGAWVASASTLYQRDGVAPPIFEASDSSSGQGGASYRWFGDLAGRCWVGAYADGSGEDRQCYALQYPNVMRASATITAGDRSHNGDAAYFPTANGLSLYYWSDAGHFGEGSAEWDGEALVLTTDVDKDSRTVWRKTGDGFSVAAERREEGDWRETLKVDYALALND